MPNYNSINASIKLISCTQQDDVIEAQYSDGQGLVIYGNADVFFDQNQWTDMLRRMLILDWLQEQVAGKTAVMDCAAADDVWVKAEVL